MMEIQQIISHHLIKPSLPTPSHLQNLPIPFLDQRLPPTTVPFIFYYQNHKINSNQLNLLKRSLSDILTLFYPLAGRYLKERFSIRCNDQGVPYSEAVVNVELSYILERRFQVHELNRLIPDDKQILEESDTSPQIAIQINIFKCGGLAIGIVYSHRIMDGFTFSLFATGWAKACKTGHMDECPVPNFESGILFPPRQNIKTLAFSKSESQVVSERFVFRKMSVSMVIAVIWRAQIKAASARYWGPRSSVLAILVNLRGRTGIKIPENICGNFFTSTVGRFHVEDHEKEMDLNMFVDKVRNETKKRILEIDEVKEDEQLYELIMGTRRQISEGEGDIHTFSNARNFRYYEVDFGWVNLLG